MLVCGPPVLQLQCFATAAVGLPWGGRCSQSEAGQYRRGGRDEEGKEKEGKGQE